MGILESIIFTLIIIIGIIIIGVLGVYVHFFSMMIRERCGEFLDRIRGKIVRRKRRKLLKRFAMSKIMWYQVDGNRGEFFILNESEQIMRRGVMSQYLRQLGKDIFISTHEVYLNRGRYDSVIFWEYIME